MFKEKSDFIGYYCRDDEDNSLKSIFELVEKIRTKLGRKSYLLDRYLSLYFDAVNSTLATDAFECGLQAAGEYQRLCFNLINGSKNDKEHPLYLETATAFLKHDVSAYQETYTKINILYLSMAEEYFEDAVVKFIEKRNTVLNGVCDIIEFREVYEKITNSIGEVLVETLNLKLKQMFLIVPAVTAFKQGFMNDLIYKLTSRDIESNKQVFQLLNFPL